MPKIAISVWITLMALVIFSTPSTAKLIFSNVPKATSNEYNSELLEHIKIMHHDIATESINVNEGGKLFTETQQNLLKGKEGFNGTEKELFEHKKPKSLDNAKKLKNSLKIYQKRKMPQ